MCLLVFDLSRKKAPPLLLLLLAQQQQQQRNVINSSDFFLLGFHFYNSRDVLVSTHTHTAGSDERGYFYFVDGAIINPLLRGCEQEDGKLFLGL